MGTLKFLSSGQTHVERSQQRSLVLSLSARMVSVLEEREDELRSLQSDLQQKNNDITGWRDIICIFKKVIFSNSKVHLCETFAQLS